MAYKYNPISGQLDLVTDLTFTSITAGLGYTPVNVAGDTMLGNLILNANPSTALGAATKQYVDNIATGINFHAPVVAATTVLLPPVTYNNVPDPLNPGVGATLTATSPGALTIDTVTFSGGGTERVLIKNQVSGVENGIYVVNVAGDPSTPFLLTRAIDADNSPTGELAFGDFCFVEQGPTNGGFGYILNTPGTIIVGVTPLSYVIFNAAQVVTAGYGLQEITPNVLSIDTSIVLDNATAALTYLTITNASLTYVPYTGATTNVNLGVNYLISPTIHGSSISSGTLTLSSTTNLTKGNILFGTSVYDEANNRLGIGTNSPNADLDIFYGTTFTAPKDLLRVKQFFSNREVFKIYDFGSSGGSQITSEWASWGFGTTADLPSGNRISVKGVTSGSGTASIIVQDSSSNYTFIVRDDGKVGIGTAAPTEKLSLVGGDFSIDNGGNIVLGTTTGTKFGTATSQKIGFFNATPIVQPAAVTTVQGIADALTSLGLLASSSIGNPTPNVQTVVSAATVTPTSANDEVTITAQAVGLTLANPTGSPSEGQALTIRIKDNGTSQTIAYGSQYRALGVTLPANTTVSKTLYLGLIYNATDTKWDVVGVSLEGADPFNGNDWIDYSGSSTVVGWSSTTSKIIRYRIIGKQMFVVFNIGGTSNSTTTTFTLPYTSSVINGALVATGFNINNGVTLTTPGRCVVIPNSNIAILSIDTSGNLFTGSGTKQIHSQFFIEIA